MGYGMLAKSFSTEFGKPCIWIEVLYLKDAYRGQGIGSRFLNYVLEQYPEAVLRLEVEEEKPMKDFIVIAILLVLVIVGISSMIKHFKHQSGCCGGGSTYVSKKKLKKVIAKKTFIVEGMTCENCKARVERTINDRDGLLAKVNLKKKEVLVLMEKEVPEEEIIAAIEKAGYTVK